MPGLLPKPDTITGCGPECLRDSDCSYDLICDYRIQRCIEKPNPCDPSPCGPRTFCMVDSHDNAVCRLKYNLLACSCMAKIHIFNYNLCSFTFIHLRLLAPSLQNHFMIDQVGKRPQGKERK